MTFEPDIHIVPRRGRSALAAQALAALLSTATGAAWAVSNGANISTDVGYKSPTGPYISSPGCATSLASGRFSESSGALTCDIDYAGVHSQSTVFAEATGPTSPTSLASVKSSAKVTMNNGTSSVSYTGQYVRAQSQAIYLDYVRLNLGQVSNLAIDFVLTGGGLSLNDPPQSYAFPASAAVWLGVQAYSGRYHPEDGSFGRGSASSPYGWTDVNTTLRQGGVTTTFVYDDVNNSADFSLQDLSGGFYRLTLGPTFFASEAYPDLMLQVGLGTAVYLYDQQTTPGYPHPSRSGSADFSDTLQMMSIAAYDGAGNDVTGSAVIGFGSAGFPAAPVPEPSPTPMLLAGLAVTWFARRRTLRD